jgi:hypothetical protein
VKNFARIDAEELPELLKKIENYRGTLITRLAIKLMALTFMSAGAKIDHRTPRERCFAAE